MPLTVKQSLAFFFVRRPQKPFFYPATRRNVVTKRRNLFLDGSPVPQQVLFAEMDQSAVRLAFGSENGYIGEKGSHMDPLSSPGIGAALSILFNLLYFVTIALLFSLLIERIWIGKSRWILLPVVLLSIGVFFLHPGLLLKTLQEVTGSLSMRGLFSITGLGILAGMIMSSL